LINQKHILFGLSGFYPKYKAGTETYVLNLAKELMQLGYKVSVIIPAIGEKIEGYKYDEVSVYSFFIPKKISTAELNGLIKPSGLKEFKQLLKKIKPDIFHLHSISRSLHAEHFKIASELNIKTVFTAHLGSTFCVRGDLLLFGKKQCDGNVKKHRCLTCFIKGKINYGEAFSHILAFGINNLLFNSPLSSNYPAYHIVSHKIHQLKILQRFSNSTIAIADWLNIAFKLNEFEDTKIIKQGINSLFIKNNETIKKNVNIKLIFVGRMHPNKGVHILVNALENISAENIDLIIITIPFEDEIKYYEDIKIRYNALGYSEWYENLNKEEVAEKLNEADVLVLPSTKNEAAPLVILEAFAKKVPVIGSDYIAIKEMVEHNVTGLIFKNGDTKSIEEQLIRLINEPELIQKFSKNIGSVRTFKDVAIEHDILYKKLI